MGGSGGESDPPGFPGQPGARGSDGSAGSSGTAGDSMGLWSTSGATITATNNILAHTSPPGANTYGVRVTSGATATLSYNDVWTHTIQYSSVAAPASDIQQDPPFLDWPNDDFHLQSSSPAVDAGVDAGVTTDIDGDPRPIGLPDIGIDEYVQWIYLPLVLRNY